MTRRAWPLFAVLSLAWGIPYLLIKIAGAELSPAVLVLARTGLATLVLLPIVLLRRADRNALPAVLRRWPALALYAVVEIVVPWVFLTRAEQTLPSSSAAMLISAVPVVAVLIATLSGRAERLGAAGVLGLAFGTAGVAALVGLDIGGSDPVAVAEVAVVVVGYALGPAILARKLSDLPGLPVMTVALGMAAIGSLPLVLAGGGLPTALPSTEALLAVLVLAVVCTALAFVAMFALVNEIGPVRGTAFVYVNPLVAVVAGALLLDETVTIWTVVGFTLVIAGSFLVTRRPAPRDPVVELGPSDERPAVAAGGTPVRPRIARQRRRRLTVRA